MLCHTLNAQLGLKYADITPIFKKDDETDKTGY